MRSRTLAERLPLGLPLVMAAVLLALLAVLAVLQWRWIGEVSRLERQRMRARLHDAAAGLARDLDMEITRAFLSFHPEAQEEPARGIARLARQYERWRAEAPYPGLVRDVFLAHRKETGGLELLLLAPGARGLVPVPWPADLAGVRRDLESAPPREEHGFRAFARLVHLAPDVPALVMPFSLSAPEPSPAPPGGRRADSWAGARLVLRLDSRVIAGEILPALTRRHFGAATGGDYAVAVLDPRHPERAFFLSDPRLPASAFGDADVRLDILGLRLFEQLHAPGPPGRHPGPGHEGAHISPLHGLHEWLRGARGGGGPGHGGEPPREAGPRRDGWVLAVEHRDGSLEEVVAALRRRNLAVSLGILVLLAATMAMLMVTTERARRLARQQIEFVAGVTHEVHTPLTAIRSAGQNLADGVAAEPAQVRRYGVLIESEGRRLSDLLGQALELAGIQSGRRVYHPRPVVAGEIVDGALADCRWLLEERGIRVERDVARDLPPVLADGPALRRAVANLVENAVKHGGGGGWVGVRVRQARQAPEVEITVSDRGPGIRREDLPHLFEPFFRGRDAATGGIPGSGLGLALVRHTAEAHGGRVTVTVESTMGPAGEPGAGSAFTLHLPAAAGEPETLPGTAEESGRREPVQQMEEPA